MASIVSSRPSFGGTPMEPAALVEAIRRSVAEFSGSERLTDDLTSVAVRVQWRSAHGPEIAAIFATPPGTGIRAPFCRDLPGSPRRTKWRAALELAVDEAASNIMKHAYHGRNDQSIHLEAEAFPGRVEIHLRHFGDAFDPSTVPPPLFDGSRDSGFGVYIIAQSVDEVRYYHDERGRNCIALIKVRKTEGR